MTFHNYIFFTIDSSIFTLPTKTRAAYREEFLDLLQKEKEVIVYSYATLGLKTNTTMLLWLQADIIDTIQNFLNKLMHSHFGQYLEITYTLLGMTRPTQYSSKSTMHLNTSRKGGQYLIIYPFIKTTEWYMLDFEKRHNLMGGHVMIGKKYPAIEQLLLYSYGIDDQEFIVSYETNDLSLFQSLVMELRSDPVRAYTQRDTPIFTCIYKSFKEIINFL